MNRIRTPAVAGLFYPENARELQAVVRQLLAAVPPAAATAPKALIAPHAGYVYSGPVAASAYARLAPARDRIRRVVVLGPSHRLRFRGIAAPRADRFATPLGAIPVDRDALDCVLSLPQVTEQEPPHEGEHALEVQLPFLQEVLEPFRMAPLVVGDADPEEVAEVLDHLWGGPETLIVVSSDLSHYHDYRTARRMDTATSRAIEALAPDKIGYEQACGRIPINGLLTAARNRGLRVETVDLRNSGDTAGPRDRVVGYGAYAFH